jgi:3-deoxy-D-arabino-heptulosonate 7-phosphate (DAHP) synthase
MNYVDVFQAWERGYYTEFQSCSMSLARSHKAVMIKRGIQAQLKNLLYSAEVLSFAAGKEKL